MPDPMFVSPYLKRRLRSLDEVLAKRTARPASPESDDELFTDDHGDDHGGDHDEPLPELRLV